MRLVVTLPRHSTPQALSDLQLSRWKDFTDSVAVHEQKHVDIYIDGMEALKKKFESFPDEFSDCDSLKSSLASAWESELTLITQLQEAFHLAEEQRDLGLIKPLQMQIDQNESELDQLQNTLDSLSLEQDELTLKIGDIERSVQPYEAQMNIIRDQYPNLVLPSAVYDEYKRLLTEWNRLNDLRNGVIAQINALDQQYNRTVEEFNLLAELTNQLVDELNWLR